MSHINELFKGLMFLHGHVTRPEDLDPGFAPLGNRAASARWFAGNPSAGATTDAPARDTPARARRRAHARTGVVARLLHDLEYLGGRPMTAGHNVDVEEPFPQSVANASAKQRAHSQPCATRRGAIAAVCGTVALSPFR
jgi:hypothetical protein